MKRLSTKTNVAAPSVAYPYGNIRNKTLLLAGTPVDVEVYGDMHQFFEKMFAESGITANGLPDNVTNGWQLYEAFQKLTHPAWSATGITFATVGSNTWANVGAPFYSVAYKNMPNEVALCGVPGINIPSPFTGDLPVMTLPASASPSSNVYLSAMLEDGSGVFNPCIVVVESAGDVYILNVSLSANDYYIRLDGITFRK